MGYICGEDRNQLQLYPATLEELLDENNPVRVIDAFVDHLNVTELGLTHAEPADTGRPPYDPRRYTNPKVAVMFVGASFWYRQMVPWSPLPVMQRNRKSHRRTGA